MNTRLKQLRKYLSLTQEDMAKKIGLKRTAISEYEIGRNTPPAIVIQSICREFGVSKEWLETGEGEMFQLKPVDEELLDEVTTLIQDDCSEIKKRLLLALVKLDDDGWEVVKSLAETMLNTKKEEE